MSAGTLTATSPRTTLERTWRAIWAITLRDLRSRYGDRRLGLFWAIVEPAMQVFLMSVVLTYLRGRTGMLGYNVAAFAAMGVMNLMLFTKIEQRVRQGIKGNTALLAFARVRPSDIYIAKFIGEISFLLLVFFMMFSIFTMLGWIGPPSEMHRVLAPVLLSSMLGFSIGLINASLIAIVPVWDKVWKLVARVNFFTCGVFFLASGMPPKVRDILYWQPLLHNNEWTRSGYYDTFESHFYDPTYTVLVTVGALFIGLVMERALRRWVINAQN